MRTAIHNWWNKPPLPLGWHLLGAVGVTLSLFLIFVANHYMARYIETHAAANSEIQTVCVGDWDCNYGEVGAWLVRDTSTS